MANLARNLAGQLHAAAMIFKDWACFSLLSHACKDGLLSRFGRKLRSMLGFSFDVLVWFAGQLHAAAMIFKDWACFSLLSHACKDGLLSRFGRKLRSMLGFSFDVLVWSPCMY